MDHLPDETRHVPCPFNSLNQSFHSIIETWKLCVTLQSTPSTCQRYPVSGGPNHWSTFDLKGNQMFFSNIFPQKIKYIGNSLIRNLFSFEATNRAPEKDSHVIWQEVAHIRTIDISVVDSSEKSLYTLSYFVFIDEFESGRKRNFLHMYIHEGGNLSIASRHIQKT